MKSFQFVTRDELGIHARPAGLLAKLAKEYKDTVITVTKAGNTVKATQISVYGKIQKLHKTYSKDE